MPAWPNAARALIAGRWRPVPFAQCADTVDEQLQMADYRYAHDENEALQPGKAISPTTCKEVSSPTAGLEAKIAEKLAIHLRAGCCGKK